MAGHLNDTTSEEDSEPPQSIPSPSHNICWNSDKDVKIVIHPGFSLSIRVLYRGR